MVIPSNSFLSIVLYSDEFGETIVEGDEEDLPSIGYDDETLFEMDDLPFHPLHPFDIQEIYSTLTDKEEQHNGDMHLLSTGIYNSFDHQGTSSYEEDCLLQTLGTSRVYSKSAPPVFLLPEFTNSCLLYRDTNEEKVERAASTVASLDVGDIGVPLKMKQQVELTTEVEKRNVIALTLKASITEINNFLRIQQYTKQNTDMSSLLEESHLLCNSPQTDSSNLQYEDSFENDLEVWKTLSTDNYQEEEEEVEKGDFELACQVSCENDQLWEYMHIGEDHLKEIKSNSFIFEAIVCHTFPIKVTGINDIKVKYKNIIKHFHDPNVVFVRYIRPRNSAYIGYRQHNLMLKAVKKFDRTSICGSIIYCRPSSCEEMDRENDIHSKKLFQVLRKGKKKLISKSNHFVPEHYGIKQESKDYRSYSFLPMIKYDVSKRISDAINYKVFLYYHPKAITTMSSVKKANINPHHRYYFDHIYPSNYPVSSYYVIVKPWSHRDIRLSQESGYWSFYPQNATVMNYLFHSSSEINFIFHVAGSRFYQGHAIMKSEIMDLRELSHINLIGTPFYQDTNTIKFTSESSGRLWRFIGKVEWINKGLTSNRFTTKCLNSWFHNIPVSRSGDCTIIEPSVGKEIVNIISLNN